MGLELKSNLMALIPKKQTTALTVTETYKIQILTTQQTTRMEFLRHITKLRKILIFMVRRYLSQLLKIS